MTISSDLIPILLQTEKFIFVSKPSGVAVHRSRECHDGESLVQILKRQTGLPLFPIHRLDRSVSGVIGFGLSSEAANELQALLKDEKTEKNYLALVRGVPKENKFTIEKTLINEHGKTQTAHTDFELIASCQYCSLLKARIHTGRRHQIRRHLSSIACQILGDRHYGKGRLNNFYQEQYGLNRIFLHSYELRLFDDKTQHATAVRAELPLVLQDVLRKLVAEGLFSDNEINQFLA